MLETLGLSAQATLNEMEELFPQTNPGPGDSLSTIMYRSGQRSVLDWLNERLKEEEL